MTNTGLTGTVHRRQLLPAITILDSLVPIPLSQAWRNLDGLSYSCRPVYRELGSLRVVLRNVPFMALTATATEEVLEDIKTTMRCCDNPAGCVAFSATSFRCNLQLRVVAKHANSGSYGDL
jgi:hypothetical protein